jgi:uncharacterized coiled-coil DUF342 family protein
LDKAIFFNFCFFFFFFEVITMVTKTAPDLNALREELELKKKDLSTLKSEFQEKNSAKELIYQELHQSQGLVKNLRASVEGLRKERDEFTKEVRNLKKKREILNKSVREKSTVKRSHEEKKDSISTDSKVVNPREIIKEIERIEKKIETEVMAFTAEQKLRKELKELKKQHAKVKDLQVLFKEANEAATNFSTARRDAQSAHKEIQKKAQDSQDKHNQIGEVYDKIKAIQIKEKPLVESYKKAKLECSELRTKMDEVQFRIKQLSGLFNEQESKTNTIHAKKRTQDVREKMKQGKKLSTEDILAFQAMKD